MRPQHTAVVMVAGNHCVGNTQRSKQPLQVFVFPVRWRIGEVARNDDKIERGEKRLSSTMQRLSAAAVSTLP